MSLESLHADVEAVLDLLGLCVVADREERDAELVEFCNSAQLVARHIAPEIVYSRRDLRRWYADNRVRLLSVCMDCTETDALITRITDPDVRDLTLSALFAISVCDYHLADEESALIGRVLELWGPGQSDVPLAEVPPQGDLLAALD